MAEETRPRRGFQQLGRDGEFLNKPNTDTQNTDDATMRKINEDFGDMEYEYDLLPFLDSIARAGFDASRMQIGTPGKDSTSYQPLGDVVTIMPAHLADKSVQAHEYRHRGLDILMQELSLDSLEFQKKYGRKLFLQLLDLKDTIRSQSKSRMVEAGNYNQYLHEMLAELYEKPEPYNRGAGYGAADAPPFSYNREAGRATTPAEHLALLENYSEETGNPIQKYVYPPVSVQEQMDELETDNQAAFREYLDTNPADRVERVFFKPPFEEGVKKQKQPLFETIDALSKFAEDANEKRGKRNPEDYFQVKELAQGGPVMRGIGTLNETARNMTRGPRGIGAYQQFSYGGPVRGDPFNGLGTPINMPYGPAQQLAYPQPQFGMGGMQQPQFGMGGMQQGNGINLYGQYLERTYGDPEFDQKRDTFLQDVQQKERQTFGGGGGSFGFPAMLSNEGSNEGYGLDPSYTPRDRFFGLEKAQIAEGVRSDEMQLFASGGEAMGPPPTRGPDPQGIGYFQQFADGGPVYMQEGGPPSAGEIKSEILDAVYEAESNSNYDQWHLNAKNIPEKPLTEMTVEEIMRYQGDNKGPAAGAGQIKFDTLQYLIDYGTIQPTDVFTVETQDKAHSRLLDRRGFQAWVSGEMSNTDFGQNVAKEYAGIPLLADEEVNGVLRPRGSSRYGGSNVARIGLDDWEGLLATAKTATPDYGTVAAFNSEAKSPFIETLTMRGEDVAMSMPVEQSERMSELGQENLADGRYFQGTKPEDVMTPSVGELLSSKYSRPRTQEAAEAKQRAMDRSKQTSLYEQFAPEGVQDLFSGIGSYIRGEEPQQEEEVNVYGSPPAKPPETFRKFLKPNSTIL